MSITKYSYSDANIAIAEPQKPNRLFGSIPKELSVTSADMQQQPADRYVTAEQFRDRFTGLSWRQYWRRSRLTRKSRSFSISLRLQPTRSRSMTLALSPDCRTSSVKA